MLSGASTGSLRKSELLWWLLVLNAGLILALIAVLPSSPAVPLAVAASVVGAYGVYRFPTAAFFGLLLFYPFYMWLEATVFTLLPAVAGMLASIGKELVLATLLIIALARRRDRNGLAPPSLWWVMAAFFVLVGVLAMVPASPIRASLLEARFHLQYLVLLPMAVLLLDGPRDRKRMVQVASIGAVAVGAAWLMVLGWVGLSGIDYAYATTALLLGEGGRFDAINVLGSHLALATLLLAGVAAHATRSGGRVVAVLTAAFLTWAMLATFSRRAVLGVAVGLVVMAVIGRRWRLLGWGALGTAMVLAVASPVLMQRFALAQADATGGVSLRTEHLWYTLQNLDPVSVFIGHGVGTAGVVSLVAGVRDAVDIHNYYLLLLYETGVVGLSLYLAICAIVMRALLRVHRARGDSLDRGLALGAIGAFAGFLVMGVFGVGNATLPMAPLVWALAGAALGAARLEAIEL